MDSYLINVAARKLLTGFDYTAIWNYMYCNGYHAASRNRQHGATGLILLLVRFRTFMGLLDLCYLDPEDYIYSPAALSGVKSVI